MALMLAICSAQPNWMPRKPKLMFQICEKLRGGRGPSPVSSGPPRDYLMGRTCPSCGPSARRSRATEVDGGDLGAGAAGKSVDHDDQTPGLHRRQLDLLALVDAVLRAHAQHL